MKEKLRGGLLGVAIGDLLGTKIETGAAQVSDDTLMTFCVAEGILASPRDPVEAVGRRFMDWYKADGFGIGKVTALAIENAMVMDNWDYGAKQAHDLTEKRSAGNGSLMRTSPVGHLYESLEDVLYFSGILSDMTHYDIKAKEACNLYSWLIYLLRNGASKEEAFREVVDFHIIYGGYDELEEEELKTSAYVEDTLLTSLWVFHRVAGFEEGILRSISLGGDRDTIGAVTGGLLGTYYGDRGIPEAYIEQLDRQVLERIDKITKEVYKC